MSGVVVRAETFWNGEPSVWVEFTGRDDAAELTPNDARLLAAELADLADQLDPPGASVTQRETAG